MRKRILVTLMASLSIMMLMTGCGEANRNMPAPDGASKESEPEIEGTAILLPSRLRK